MMSFNEYLDKRHLQENEQPHDALAMSGHAENIQWWMWANQQHLNPQQINQVAIALKGTPISVDAWKTQMAQKTQRPSPWTNDETPRTLGSNARW